VFETNGSTARYSFRFTGGSLMITGRRFIIVYVLLFVDGEQVITSVRTLLITNRRQLPVVRHGVRSIGSFRVFRATYSNGNEKRCRGVFD